MDIIKKLTEELNIKPFQAENTVKLLDEGATIPFIARYRKELTGSLDDASIRLIAERLEYLRGLDERREQIIRLIDEQDALTDELTQALNAAETLAALEDLYRPYKPKRRVRASIAKEKGLQPLADIISLQKLSKPIEESASQFINEEKGVASAEEALAGAMDIIAEDISDNAEIRAFVRENAFKNGLIKTSAKNPEEKTVYDAYYDFSEPVKKIPSHRILAVNRGEKEGALTVKVEVDEENVINGISRKVIIKNGDVAQIMGEIIKDSYSRLIQPSIEREIRNELTEKAEAAAIKVFSENLKQLLLQPPIKGKRVMAMDPGYRAGCKIAVIDETGKPLETTVAYFATKPNSAEKEKADLLKLIEKHNVELLAIGNGTASRETEAFAADMIKLYPKTLRYIIVNEAGASVYSASKLGAEEFPDMDVALRSSVSIGRRLQDPLAELVKIDPKSIGVGQYQRDMNQKNLSQALNGVVESCVNSVGVDLNTASPALLSYVAGINGAVAKNILKYREENGVFKNRKELLKVSKLGPKAFEQCAGFLRIPESEQPLDNTGIHPESYAAAERLLDELGLTADDVKQKRVYDISKRIKDIDAIAEKLGVGAPTLKDVIKELEKPGRDPREEMPAPFLRSDVLSIDDLSEGMILKGTVRNITDFGAFIDIGAHNDGLVHISQMSDKFIKRPLDVVSVGDVIDVKILSVDKERERVALSMKGIR